MQTKMILSVLISFGISVVLCPIIIPFLKRLKFGQNIREEGPKDHLKKTGTPTMGELIILFSIVITSLYFIDEYKIHHHFELCGWSETRVVTVFSIITAVMCLIAYLAL